MKIFGDVDRASKAGNVASEMPAWYHRSQIDNLREDIDSRVRALESGRVPADRVPDERQELANLKHRLEAIEESKPQISDVERNKLWKYYKQLGGLIQDTLFTNDDMRRGTADPHEEARRMTEHIIPVNNEIKKLAKSCNVKISKDGRLTRNGASKIWKIVGRLINEPTNVEVLRRESIHAPVYEQEAAAN